MRRDPWTTLSTWPCPQQALKKCFQIWTGFFCNRFCVRHHFKSKIKWILAALLNRISWYLLINSHFVPHSLSMRFSLAHSFICSSYSFNKMFWASGTSQILCHRFSHPNLINHPTPANGIIVSIFLMRKLRLKDARCCGRKCRPRKQGGLLHPPPPARQQTFPPSFSLLDCGLGTNWAHTTDLEVRFGQLPAFDLQWYIKPKSQFPHL